MIRWSVHAKGGFYPKQKAAQAPNDEDDILARAQTSGYCPAVKADSH
jgi:hypothetical protein